METIESGDGGKIVISREIAFDTVGSEQEEIRPPARSPYPVAALRSRHQHLSISRGNDHIMSMSVTDTERSNACYPGFAFRGHHR